MEFRVGSITAKCLTCGCTTFEASARETPGRRHSTYCCALCKAATSYSELILQIGHESARRTKARLSLQRERPADERAAILRLVRRDSPG